MRLLYFFAIQGYVGIIRLASLFNPKAKKWIQGRKNPLPKPGANTPILFHCASLGEFEQAVPVLQKFNAQRPDLAMWVSFYSPSGFEHAKLPDFVEQRVYLPIDTPKNVRRFLSHGQFQAIVCVKYEIWPELLIQAKKLQIPVALIAANFRENQIYFKPWGFWFKKLLNHFSSIGHQYPASQKLLQEIHSNNYLMGDTRFARAIETANSEWQDELIDKFCEDEQVLILGSCWEPELEHLYKALDQIEGKIILAPHRIDRSFIDTIQIQLANQAFRYSQGFTSNKKVLIIDSIGKLKYLYRKGYLAFIGGGYKNQLHNIIEALAYEIPVCFGPKHQKYPEAQRAIDANCGFEIHSDKELIEFSGKFRSNRQAGQSTKKLIEENKNAAEISFQKLQQHF